MKGTSPSRVSRASWDLRLTATKCHDGKCKISSTYSMGKSIATILTIAIDLAKNVFAVRGVDATSGTHSALTTG